MSGQRISKNSLVNITNAIGQIHPDLRATVMKIGLRMRATYRSRGGHLNDIIFYT